MAILSYGENQQGVVSFIITIPRTGTAKPFSRYYHTLNNAIAGYSAELDSAMREKPSHALLIDKSFRHARRASLAIERGLRELGPQPGWW